MESIEVVEDGLVLNILVFQSIHMYEPTLSQMNPNYRM